MMPAASAVVSDIVDLSRNLLQGIGQRVPLFSYHQECLKKLTIKNIREVVTRYYLRFSVLDQPGVLSTISGILGRHDISIHSVIQKGRRTEDVTVCNTARTHCAVATVKDAKTTLYLQQGPRPRLWSVPGWSRSLFVSADGKYVARGYGGLNLLSYGDGPDTVMVEFLSGGKSTAKVRLKDLVKDLSKLPPTASHYLWGSNRGFDASGVFVVGLYDGSEVKVDPATGKRK